MNLKLYVVSLCLCLFVSFVDAKPFVISKLPTRQKVVALTFDDGPNPKYTAKLLTILKKQRVEATFFLVGKSIDKYPNLAKRIIQNGHSVGNHSYYHRHLTTVNEQDLLTDVAKSQLVFWENLEVVPLFFRPPFGSNFDRHSKELRKHFNYIVNWSIDPQEWKGRRSNKEIIKSVIKELKPGRIILLHESAKTVSFLPDLIKTIRAQGYGFVDLESVLSKTK